jgi:enoyl-CoA hydratase/carnithine racemase
MVTHVVADGALMEETKALARRIAAQPFEAVCAHKRAMYQGLNMPLAAPLDMVSSHTAILPDAQDHRDRVAAFLEQRRKPLA